MANGVTPGWKIVGERDLRVKGSFYAFVLAVICLATAYFNEIPAVDFVAGVVSFVAASVWIGLTFLGGDT